MTKRVYKEHEFLSRAYKTKLRQLKRLCEKYNVLLYDYESAPNDSICIFSKNEYEIGESINNCAQSTDSYFIVDHVEEIKEKLY